MLPEQSDGRHFYARVSKEEFSPVKVLPCREELRPVCISVTLDDALEQVRVEEASSLCWLVAMDSVASFQGTKNKKQLYCNAFEILLR